jgi:transcriptional regulator with PAS, ATPase and Fis domain
MLITGESGTGKEVLARHIHELSPRRGGPFVAINCSAIPATLFESELFGYERGAFTGAQRTTPGKVEAAHGGTLFLDEIGDLDLSLQPKLLRFLQERVFYRVGGTRAISADVRIIAATNTDLEAAVREGRFRQDLLYRLNVMQLHMPPLRERREDIPALIDYFVMRCANRLGVKVLGANDAAVALLQSYDWPGNIRELENAIERAVLLARGRILTPADFSWIQASQTPSASAENARQRQGGLIMPLMSIADAERRLIERALRETNWNQMRAAEILGIHRNTLRNKIAEYGLDSLRP